MRFSRRSLVEWLGKSAVLALGAPLIEACGGGGDRPGSPLDASSQPGRDGGSAAGDSDAGSIAFPFQPGSGTQSIFQNWAENTVDPQDLTALLASWTLTIDGMVDHPQNWHFADLFALPRQDQSTDFFCVEGWSVQDVPWNGIALSTLLDLASPTAQASYLTFHTFGDRYNESLPIAVAREPHSLLAYGVAGTTLPLAHGFPLRLVVPRLLGYKNAKYVYRVELTDQPVKGYWVAAGYSYAGEVPASELRPGHF